MRRRLFLLIAALSAFFLISSCTNPQSVLDDYNSHFTPVATSQATFELTEETQGDMLEPTYRVKSYATLCLTAPAVGSSYRWSIRPFDSSDTYYWTDQTLSIYIPEHPALFDGTHNEVACELGLVVVKDGVRYKDSAILIIEK